MNQENQPQSNNFEEGFKELDSEINLLEQLPFITEGFINNAFKSHPKRDLDVIRKRFGLNNERIHSLEEIGIYYDISRERVRQIEFKVVSKLINLLNDFDGEKESTLEEKIVREYKQLRRILTNLDYILAEEYLKEIFCTRYRITLKECESLSTLNFLMELLGYCQIPSKINGYRGLIRPAWCLKEKFNKSSTERVLRHLKSFLDKPDQFKFFDLVVSINKAKGDRLDKDFIRMNLQLCPEIEKVDNEEDLYQVKFEFLSSVAEKAFRILQENGKPIHFSEIAKTINQIEHGLGKGRRVKVENLKNQLIVDNRFKPIGRSGLWSLSDWDNIDTKTITKVMEDSFHELSRPLSVKEVYQYVIDKRPDASFRSVSAYLSNTDLFVRVDANQFALTTWGLKSLNKSIRRTSEEASSLINAALKQIFLDKDSMQFSEVVHLVKEKTKLAEMTIRNKIKNSQSFELAKEGTSNNYTVYCVNREFEEEGFVEPKKELLRDKIQGEVVSILQANPNKPITKGELFLQVKKEINCLRPTFYAYLSSLKDVKQYTENGKSYCVFEYHERKDSINIDSALLDSCSELELLNTLERAISKLNIDEIDLGLFELGRIFENELREYLIIAQKHSIIQVYRKDLEKLASMINCVVREKVVSKGFYLHVLREERNERAHGSIPNLDERKNIFNKAHYVAELYIQNIIFFNDKKHKILADMENFSAE